ncbi:hypothetical protein Tco_1481341, partial [Tanacetum coccineum]
YFAFAACGLTGVMLEYSYCDYSYFFLPLDMMIKLPSKFTMNLGYGCWCTLEHGEMFQGFILRALVR